MTTPAGPAAVAAPSPMRSFDPRAVGRLETASWVAYYRHEWLKLLRAAVMLTRTAFGMSWPRTLYGAWLVMRANMLWAPYPDNNPDGARRCMRRFYTLLAKAHGEVVDPARAAELEVEWWRVHRIHQRGPAAQPDKPLVDALCALYSHVYRVSPDSVRLAASERADAMRISDEWVEAGCDLDSPLVPAEQAALVRSYAALLAAVHVVGTVR